MASRENITSVLKIFSTVPSFVNSSAIFSKVVNGSNEENAVLPIPLLPTSPMTPGPVLESVPTTSGTWINRSSPDSQSVALLLIPLLLMISLAFFSGIALYCMQRRKKLDRLRHRLIPMYSFAPGEEDEWGVLLNHDQPHHHR